MIAFLIGLFVGGLFAQILAKKKLARALWDAIFAPIYLMIVGVFAPIYLMIVGAVWAVDHSYLLIRGKKRKKFKQ